MITRKLLKTEKPHFMQICHINRYKPIDVVQTHMIVILNVFCSLKSLSIHSISTLVVDRITSLLFINEEKFCEIKGESFNDLKDTTITTSENLYNFISRSLR